MSAVTEQLGEFLADVVMTSHYLAEPAAEPAGNLHDAEMKCLKIIATIGPLKMHQLAETLHATKARATQLVTTLEQLGYVARGQGTDLRTKLVSATELGQAIVLDTRQKYHELAKAIELKLGTKRASELCTLLAEITPLSVLTSNQTKEFTL
ncbi:MarR family transcriptional regulator [Candidatus Saccharibacteria bacterium]|nr:MarR family transcriptional regulator [Candidatus Saccharibacteria bacterium]